MSYALRVAVKEQSESLPELDNSVLDSMFEEIVKR